MRVKRNPILGAWTDFESRKTKIDRKSSNLIYTGVAASHLSQDSDSDWLISRQITIGTVTTTEYANQATFTCRWTDRETLFSAASPNNLYSVEFDGVNDYISLGDSYNYDRSTAHSWSFWVKPQNTAAVRYFAGKMTNDTASVGWRLGHTATGNVSLQVRPAGQGLAGITFNSQLIPQQWNHVVITYSGAGNATGWNLYLNGVLDTFVISSQVYGYSWLSPQPLMLGTDRTTSYFSGKMDEVAVWNKALSQQEVSEVYGGGAPPNLLSLLSASQLTGWWRMGDGDMFPTVANAVGVINGTLVNMSSNNFVLDTP